MQSAIIFGATGRVGRSTVEQALAGGHRVTAYVRNPGRLDLQHDRLRVVAGELGDGQRLRDALRGHDAAIMAIGTDVTKPSTVVTDAVRAILAAMTDVGLRRYLGVSGTIALPPTPLGRLTVWLMRHSPIRHGVADHQHALELVLRSDLDYVLAACPHIRDGELTTRYREVVGAFGGGYRHISPEDVAHFFVRELTSPRYHRQAVGLWM